jgi:hypothetical protein
LGLAAGDTASGPRCDGGVEASGSPMGMSIAITSIGPSARAAATNSSMWVAV